MIDDTATLDPPGSIAVVGAGPLGIEAALYGRYLGYDVTLLEAVGVASSLAGADSSDGSGDAPIPMMPDRAVSPLARSALMAQSGTGEPWTSPTTIGQWIDQVWMPLTQTDLLRGRLKCPAEVTSIELVDVQPDPDDNDDPDVESESGRDVVIEPDFRLILQTGDPVDAEAVILATGGDDHIRKSFEIPRDYFFQVGGHASDDAEAAFWTGLKEIVAIYASLGGRADLDLYRPLRG
ncbi:hypothetical protein FYK55_08440 [Roseiconus nitratireducens]|uniref:Pyridine nucleotide-disulfide oxidoreductase n=1 Tax=Roseiconus nitratireducens TaxID=2605748 RepID=A0A5M6DD21_9BACT|nr:hypothetical protein [Roseiconus nitratireducens]KAA5544366.1 hypothetical protein FYK55_08440 [Roseiconus nitratireducens]